MRIFRGPRHTSISSDPITAALQNAENARDTLEALASRLKQRHVTVDLYTAAGSTSAKIPLGASDRPLGVQLIRAAPYYDQTAPLSATGNGNFLWDATTQPGTINAFEPDGLTANTVYTLTYIVTEA